MSGVLPRGLSRAFSRQCQADDETEDARATISQPGGLLWTLRATGAWRIFPLLLLSIMGGWHLPFPPPAVLRACKPKPRSPGIATRLPLLPDIWSFSAFARLQAAPLPPSSPSAFQFPLGTPLLGSLLPFAAASSSRNSKACLACPIPHSSTIG